MHEFIHLHCHNEFSELDGMYSITEWLRFCSEMNFRTFGLTNHGNVSGWMEYYIEAQKFKVKPILGLEGYISFNYDKERNASHLLLFAKNNEGYKNILRLQKISWTDGFYYIPRILYSDLLKYHDGIIISTACLSGLLARLLFDGKHEEFYNITKELKEIFNDDFYIELMLLDLPETQKLNYNLLKLSQTFGIKTIITNDCHYLRPEDADIQDKLVKISNPNFEIKTKQLWLKNYDELKESYNTWYRDIIPLEVFYKSLENTLEIYEKVNVEIELGTYKLPKFDIISHPYYKSGMTKEDLFTYVVNKNFELKIKNPTEEYINRKNYELDFILKASDFIDYFLIVEDIVRWAKSNNIEVGMARGSVAGSLIAYLLGITVIDPIKFGGLLFERFLNPARLSKERAKQLDALPDIDLDFSSEKRNKVKEYIIKKYGIDKVCEIGSYGRLQAKAAIKDIGRVLDKPFADINEITKSVKGNITTIEEGCEKSAKFSNWYNQNKEWVDKYVKPIIGQVRHASKHPAGVLISKDNLENHIALKTCSFGNKRIIISQWEDIYCERAGLMKLDILGLTQLDIFKYAKELIKERCDKEIDLNNLELNDKRVLELFAKGDTLGVFQFNSQLLTNYIKELKPTDFEDLVVANALIRPGPYENEFHIRYMNCKHGKGKPVYLHPILEKILKKTYGVVVYQEDLMRILHELGGLTLAESDLARTAMKKHDKSLIEGFKDTFVASCVSKGMSKEVASNYYEDLLKFSNYAFNRSHSASYTYVAYASQWLKAYYPLEFFTALLEYSDKDEMSDIYSNMKSRNIKVLLPDIFYSKDRFYLIDDVIVFPIRCIDGVGDKVVKAILETNSSSFREFIDKANKRIINKKVVLKLILSGLFNQKVNKIKELFCQYTGMSYEKMTSVDIKLLRNQILKMKIYDLKNIYKKELVEKDVYNDISSYNEFIEKPIDSYVAVVTVANKTYKIGKSFYVKGMFENEVYNIVAYDNVSAKKLKNIEKNDIIVVYGKKIIGEYGNPVIHFTKSSNIIILKNKFAIPNLDNIIKKEPEISKELNFNFGS